MKDPAFLFYTKDFQSGTQDMSVAEVGAYIRLLCYQHQHGFIPDNRDRLMRITGIFNIEEFDLVWEVVQLKFNQMANHLVNQRLDQEVKKRANYKPKKIASATLAGLISSSKLNLKDIQEIKKKFKIDDFIEEDGNLIIDESIIKTKVKEWFKKMVNQMVNNLANGNGNGNANENEELNNIGGMGEIFQKDLSQSESYIDPRFKEPFEQWLSYKRERKESYKSQKGKKACYDNLVEMSQNNPKTAIAIVKRSMANNWAGLFPLNENGAKASNKPDYLTITNSSNSKEDLLKKLENAKI